MWESRLCFVCGKRTIYDPTKVHYANGHPLCAPCMRRVNELLEDGGQRPLDVIEGTYPE